MNLNPLRAVSRHLYLRIWLTVIGSVVVLALGAAAAWRIARDSQPLPPAPTPREITVRNAAGDVVGGGLLRGRREPGQPLTFSVTLRNGESLQVELAPRPRRPGEEGYRPPPGMDPSTHSGPGPHGGPHSGPYAGAHPGAGPGATAGPRHFSASSGDMRGRPRPPDDWLPPWLRPPYGFVWMLAAVSLAVALALYPVVRRMTKRLEALQQGVQRWGEGELAVRLPEDGQDEVADLSRRFNAAAARIESLLESQKALLASQRSLLANASHELRSPLARIRMALELMGERPSTALRDELARNIGELDQLIDEILLASRLDAREADLGSVEPVDLTGIAVEECMRADVALHLPDGQPPVVVPGVAKLLRRLLRNLVENAKRHGGQGVEVNLRREAHRAELVVSDRGPGVPPEERERIFEPFYRARGASERDGGVGLGLALVKSIAERHGGQVRCETRPGGGAMFVVQLPA